MSFDSEVKVGEIRVFADVKEPLVAAVVGSRGLSGWRIVPVSPYREPVNESELKIGERVFQLWNACTASKGFVARSWVVDTLSATDLARLAAQAASLRMAAHDGRLGDYERRTLAVGGDFAGWQSKFPAKRKWVWPTASWAAAAVVLVSVGVFYLLPQDAEESAPGEHVMTLRMEKPEPGLVVAECVADEPDAAPAPANVEIDLQVEKAEVARYSPAPDVRKVAEAAKMAPAPETRLEEMKPDAVVVKQSRQLAPVRKKAAGGHKGERSFEVEIAETLRGLKYKQRPDGSWGAKPVKDTALVVLAMMANGATADSPEYGRQLTAGVKYLTEANLGGQSRQDVQIAACALCCATAAVRNPNVRTAAEKALESIGDRRSVEVGRDWSGLLVDLAQPKKAAPASGVAAEPPERDEIAEAGVYVLQLLSASGGD